MVQGSLFIVTLITSCLIVHHLTFGSLFMIQSPRTMVSRFRAAELLVSEFKLQGCYAAGTEFWGIISVIPHRENKIPSPNYLSM